VLSESLKTETEVTAGVMRVGGVVEISGVFCRRRRVERGLGLGRIGEKMFGNFGETLDCIQYTMPQSDR
jgi:hypothetical protein